MKGIIAEIYHERELYGIIDAGDEYAYMFGPNDVIGGPRAYVQFRTEDVVEFNTTGEVITLGILKAINVRRIA